MVGDIRAALAAAFQDAFAIQCSPYELANPTPPTMQVLLGEVAYDRAGSRGLDEYAFEVQLMVGYTTDEGAQRELDTYLEPGSSAKDALQADRTLGGLVYDMRVVGCSGQQAWLLAGSQAPALGTTFTVQALVRGA